MKEEEQIIKGGVAIPKDPEERLTFQINTRLTIDCLRSESAKRRAKRRTLNEQQKVTDQFAKLEAYRRALWAASTDEDPPFISFQGAEEEITKITRRQSSLISQWLNYRDVTDY